MKTLKESFRLNKLLYTLLKRNELVALYGIGGTYSDDISYYEVSRIIVRDDKYGKRESLPSNEQWDRLGGRSFKFNNYNAALRYFGELTERVKLLQGVPKTVTGVEEDARVVPEYQAA